MSNGIISAVETLIGSINSTENVAGTLNGDIIHVYPELVDLNVIPSTEQQIFNHEQIYGYDKVTVDEIPNNFKQVSVEGEKLILSYNVDVNEEELEL